MTQIKKQPKSNGPAQIDVRALQKARELFRVVGHPQRMKIMQHIEKEKEVPVNQIYGALGYEQSITSQHLRELREVGAVTTRREGKKIFYSLDADKFAKINSSLAILN